MNRLTLILAAILLFLPFVQVQAEPMLEVNFQHRLSTTGSDRATRYRSSNKVVTCDGKTHVAWLNWVSDTMVASYDHASGSWSAPVKVGTGTDNHGGPALTIDSRGYLDTVFGPHGGPFQHARSAQSNQSSQWIDLAEFASGATYPSTVVDEDDTLHIVYRGGNYPYPGQLMYQRLPNGGAWSQPRPLAEPPAGYSGYTHYHCTLAIGPDNNLHMSYDIYLGATGTGAQVAGYMMSDDGGDTWRTADGSILTEPVTPDSDAFFRRTTSSLGTSNIAIDSQGRPWITLYDYEGQSSANVYLYHHDGVRWQPIPVNSLLPAEAAGAEIDPYTVVTLDRQDRIYLAGLIDGGVAVLYSTDTGFELLEVEPAAEGFFPYGVNVERPTGHNRVDLPWLLYSSGHGGVKGVPSDVFAVRLRSLIPGDANGDGKVDDRDASYLAIYWQYEGPIQIGWEHGDFNGDGKVTDADAAILAAHWQQGVEALPVPEPLPAVLFVGSLFLLAVWRPGQ